MRNAMRRRRPLTFDLLEDRRVPAAFGTAWPDGRHLTLSFMPDGAAGGGQTSALFQTLDARLSRTTWQREVLRAFQTWAARANLNIGVVADGGQDQGTAGAVQGDDRFGDIRVTAAPLTSDIVAYALPFDVTAGTWAGDVTLNTAYKFGSTKGEYDLFTVFLHEAGHALGLPPSGSRASVMYNRFTGKRTGLAQADVNALQALYGAREQDLFDRQKNNGSLARATQLQFDGSGGSGVRAVTVEGDITSAGDVDYYKVQLPSDLAGMAVRLQTSGLSLLTAGLSVYNESRQLVATTRATDPLAGDLTLNLGNLRPGGTYFVRVEGAARDVFGVGGYRLTLAPPGDGGDDGDDGGLADDDRHGNDEAALATVLEQRYRKANDRFDAALVGSFSDDHDVDYYRIRTPKAASGKTVVMTVVAWARQAGGPDPVIQVLDKRGEAVAARVLVNAGGQVTVQVPSAHENEDYFLKVLAADGGTGDYFFGVDFGPHAVALENFAAGTLRGDDRQAARTLDVAEGQLFHFVLSGRGSDPAVETAVRLTIYDDQDNVVLSRVVLDGETRSVTTFLNAGRYTFRLAAAARDGSPLPAFQYELTGTGLSDPIGPQAADTTLAPASPKPPGGTTSPYTWLTLGYYAILSSGGTYSTPW